MRKISSEIIVGFLLGVLLGCGKNSGSGAGVSGTANFIQGAGQTTVSTWKSQVRALTANLSEGLLSSSTPFTQHASTVQHSLTQGTWYFSPDKGQVTFTSLSFQTSGGGTGNSNGSLTNSTCPMTYDRSQPSGTALTNCPFTVPAGTYTSMMICWKNTYQVMINDTTVGLYTDPSNTNLVTTTAPSTPQYVPYSVSTAQGDPCDTVALPTPLTVTAGTPVSISIVTDMTRTIYALVSSSGVPSFDPSPASGASPIQLAAVPGTTGNSEYYTTESTLVYNGLKDENFQARVFYASKSVPVSIQYLSYITGCDNSNDVGGAYAYSPGDANAMNFKSGYYLGVDSSNNLAWAMPAGTTLVLNRPTTKGGKTTVYCKTFSTPPAPTSGSTYSSGAPVSQVTSSPTGSGSIYLQAM